MSSAAAMAVDAALRRRRCPSETAPRSLNATTQTPSHPPSRRVATTRPIFYGPINLAKVLTFAAGRGQRRHPAVGVAVSARKIGRFRSNEWETIINYIAIAPAQYYHHIARGRHVRFH